LLVAHALRGEGFDASEDGTGRGTPIVPISFGGQMSTPMWDFDLSQTLQAKNPQAIAFSAKDYGGDAEFELSPTLRAGGHSGSHANAGVMPAIAFGLRSDAGRSGEAKTPSADAEGRVRLRDAGFNVYEGLAPTLDAGAAHTVATEWAVRRLMPQECERLQGFPDGYTAIPKAADGPRYKALGNSMAVNVMRWLGTRIQMVNGLSLLPHEQTGKDS
jgi:DNA (cytosine-5)-methyltransferase 1